MKNEKQPPPRAPDSFARVVADVREYVLHLKADGVRTLEISPTRQPTRATPAPPRPPEPRAAPKPAPAPQPQPASNATTEQGLAAIRARVAQCKKCPLWETRTQTVPGQGNAAPEIMFIGEGPGEDEDLQGLAFVGKAGQLLTKIIEAMGFTRDQVFIGNIVKCRPPGNRVPLPDEREACLPFLKEQIALLRPAVIVALGATAVKGLLGIETGITKLRGKWLEYEGAPLMPTFHPAYLLRNPSAKREVWDDMKQVLARIGRAPPTRSK